jgi:FixJ family two-component response regulator
MNQDTFIIVIDDSPTMANLTQKILEDKGYRVRSFHSFEEAYSFLSLNPVDLVIADFITKEEMSGLDFYIRHLMDKKIKCALWSGTVDLSLRDDGAGLHAFFKRTIRDLKISFNFEKAKKNRRIDLLVEDFAEKRMTVIPLFQKASSLDVILNYFAL